MNTIGTATAYLVGLDLGERVDFTALSVLRQHAVPTGRTVRSQVGFSRDEGMVYDTVPELEYQYDLIFLDRWRGRGYKAAVPIVAELLQELRQESHRQRLAANILNTPDVPVWVLADETGVGVPVVEDLRAAGLVCTGIVITGGDTWSQTGQGFRVPKQALVSTLRVLVENHRISVSDALPLGSVLEAELQNFRVKTKLTTGNESYGAGAGDLWREGAHDDLVLSVAMACWFGEHCLSDDESDEVIESMNAELA